MKQSIYRCFFIPTTYFDQDPLHIKCMCYKLSRDRLSIEYDSDHVIMCTIILGRFIPNVILTVNCCSVRV